MITPFSADFAILIGTAAVLSVLLQKLKQPTIIAYILTGFLLGPAAFNLVGDSEFIALLSELGLAFLLFFLGIDMNLEELEDLLWPLARIGAWQTVLQTLLAFFTAWILGFTSIEVLIIGLCTVFGATPVVVKLLNDKGELGSLPGRIDVGVLVLQDIYIIALLALLSAPDLGNAWLITYSLLKIGGLIAVVGGLAYLSSQHVLPVVFRRVARNQHAFFIHGIAWAFILITTSLALNLSIEMGAFLAGLALGQIPYQGELKERVRPLTTFFMIVFFSSIGLGLSLDNLTAYWAEALIGGTLLMVGNFFIMYYLISQEGFGKKTSFLGSINMTQASEFSLVVGGIAVSQGYIGGDILGYLSVMALVTMATSAVLINKNQALFKRFKPYLPATTGTREEPEKRTGHTVIVGYDDAVKTLLPALEGDITIVDNKPEDLETLKQSEHQYIYGNFFHEAIRNEANIQTADFVISVLPSLSINKRILKECDSATVVVKAENLDEAAELYDLGADYVLVKDIMMAERLLEAVESWEEGGLSSLSREERQQTKEVLGWPY